MVIKNKKLNKKALSTIVASLIMILLVLVAVGIVWTFINNLLQEATGNTGCFNVFDEVVINSQYTCYTTTPNELQVSVNVKDLEIDAVLISISGSGATKSYIINDAKIFN